MLLVAYDFSMAVNLDNLMMIGRKENKVVGYDCNMREMILAEFESEHEASEYLQDLIANYEGGNRIFYSDSIGGKIENDFERSWD